MLFVPMLKCVAAEIAGWVVMREMRYCYNGFGICVGLITATHTVYVAWVAAIRQPNFTTGLLAYLKAATQLLAAAA